MTKSARFMFVALYASDCVPGDYYYCHPCFSNEYLWQFKEYSGIGYKFDCGPWHTGATEPDRTEVVRRKTLLFRPICDWVDE